MWYKRFTNFKVFSWKWGGTPLSHLISQHSLLFRAMHSENPTDISDILPLVYTNKSTLHHQWCSLLWSQWRRAEQFFTCFSFLSVQLSENTLTHTFCINIQSSQPQCGVALPLTCSCLPVNLVLLCHHESILLPSKHFHGLTNSSNLHSSHLHLLCIY